MKKLIYKIIIFFFIIPLNGHAHFLDGVNLQYAGEIGFLSIGPYKNITPRYHLHFMYGYVPESHTDAPIETIVFKQDYIFKVYDVYERELTFYGGLNTFHVMGFKYATSRASEPPTEYYPIGSVRAQLYLGLNYEFSKREHIYFENGINDVWIVNYLSNKGKINPNAYMSMALGYRYAFH